MYDKFLSIDAEKQERILNAAMKEFASKGYGNASTNEIVKEAEISKGLLFHYFQNKKQLFLYIYDYCLDISIKEVYEQVNFEETDLFAKIRQLQVIKLEVSERHPEFFSFFEVAYLETSAEIKPELDQRNTELLTSSVSKLFQHIDTTKFKDGVDVSKVINIVLWTLEGFGQQLLKTAKLTGTKLDYHTAFKQTDEYIEVLRTAFYK